MTNYIPVDAGWLLDEYDAESFWQNVNFHGGDDYLDDSLVDLSRVAGECWRWEAAKDSANGEHFYGSFTIWGVKHRAHRIAYRDSGKKLSEGHVIDHLCRNTLCVNPAHLEATTQKVNMSRGRNAFANRTHCRNGHELTESSVKHTGKSWRCKVCISQSKRRSYLRSKEAV